MVRQKNFHMWFSSCWLFGVSLWAGVRHFLLWLRTRLSDSHWGLHSGFCEAQRKAKEEPPIPPCQGVSKPLSPECPAWFLQSYWKGLLKLTVCSASRQTPGSVLALWWLWWGGGEETQEALRRLVITSILSHLAIPPRRLWPKFRLCAFRHEALPGSQYSRS